MSSDLWFDFTLMLSHRLRANVIVWEENGFTKMARF